MSKYIDADLYVEMQIYDDEHEEWSIWNGTIEDLLNQWTEEGCPTAIEVSEDCISRQAAIDAFCDDCRGLKPGQCEHWDSCKSQKELRLLPPVTPTVKVQQADTLIIATALQDFAQDSERKIPDRERASKLREQVLAYGASMCYDTPTEDREVSTIDIDRPQGVWIPKEFPYAWYYPKCSICGFENEGELNNYCPNCGADMRGDNK